MKKIILTLIMILPALLSWGQSPGAEYPHYIEVTGRAEKEYTPNQIFVKLVITEVDSRGKKSLEALEKSLFAQLEKIGITTDKNITISDIESTLEKFILRKDNVARQREYIIETNSSSQAIELFEILIKHELTNATITHIGLSDPEAVGCELVAEATLNASKRAQAIAGSLNQELGKAIYAQSYSSSQGQMVVNSEMRMKMEDSASQSNFEYNIPEFRKIKISQTVTVRFQLK